MSNVGGPYNATSGVNFSAAYGSLAAGDHTYTITATDKAGHSSTVTASFTTVAVANSGPTIGQVAVSQTRGRISWNAADSDGLRGCTLELDGIRVSNIAGPFAAASGANFSASLGTLASGNHTYKISATDHAGNTSILNGSFTVDASSSAAKNAVLTAESLSALSNSAKVDWLYDLGGLLDSTPSGAKKKDASANAFDTVLAKY